MTGWLSSSAGAGIRFESTQWGLVSAAGSEGETGQTALTALYQSYCYPVYAFVRRRGYNREDAQDITHDFFLYLLEKGLFGRAEPGQGKFRSFLLASLTFFLNNAARWSARQKRGGQAKLIFLNDEGAEEAYGFIDPGLTPEQIFDVQWALTLVDESLGRLKAEMDQAGRGELFNHLSGFLVGTKQASYLEAAEQAGMSVPAIKAAIYRLRVRYRELLRSEIARTVATSGDFDSELRALESLVGGFSG
jgi:DNA-directed RNA polymerase specialized sigma24 family protein